VELDLVTRSPTPISVRRIQASLHLRLKKAFEFGIIAESRRVTGQSFPLIFISGEIRVTLFVAGIPNGRYGSATAVSNDE
jgi:hypothetical protein